MQISSPQKRVYLPFEARVSCNVPAFNTDESIKYSYLQTIYSTYILLHKFIHFSLQYFDIRLEIPMDSEILAGKT